MKMKQIWVCALLFVTLFFQPAVGAVAPSDTKDLGAIWFLGDSITQSNCDNDPEGSPRKSLYDLLNAEGYTFTYTGHHTRNVDGLPITGTNVVDNLYHYHSGISGAVIGDPIRRRVGMTKSLTAFWNSGRLAVVKPDVILIMLGTNNMIENTPETPEQLKQLIDSIYGLPDVGNPTVFLASIPPMRRRKHAEDAENVAAYNAAVPSIVEGFRKRGKNVRFVDQLTSLDQTFSSSMRPDKIHPNTAGNDLIAQQWFIAIEAAFFAVGR